MSSPRIRLLVKIARIVLLLTAALLLWGGGHAWNARAEPASGYDLSWWTVGGGGASTTGGIYTLGGTIGQADASQWAGGIYRLNSGFWSGVHLAACPNSHCQVYLPSIRR